MNAISRRLLHVSAIRSNLVGSPDPISHIRPVLYTKSTPVQPDGVRHPYLLNEFTEGETDGEVQWALYQQQLDKFNHDYWFDSNTRFESAKQSVLSSLPDSVTGLQREQALSEFYKKWMVQESERQNEYSSEWRRRNTESISLATRLEWQNVRRRLSDLF